MDSNLYKAVIRGDLALLWKIASPDSSVLFRVTTRKENILHIAIKYHQEQMVREIVNFLPSLVNQKNSKGDTPLHIAARLGSYQIVHMLINCSNSMDQGTETGERLTRMTNMKKDTALHHSVRKGHFQISELLLNEDRELALFTNDVGESPLFIAVDKKYVDIARRILQVSDFFYEDNNHMNVLHAIVVRSLDRVIRLPFYLGKFQSFANYLINFLYKDFGSRTISLPAPNDSSYRDFVEFLIRKCHSALSQTDDNKWTPLHYAVHYGAVSIVKLFLRDIDTSTACIRDKEGMSVLHIAVREGEAMILELLADHFPEVWDLQDNRGQTILHLAIARENMDFVKFILGNVLSQHDFINQQDNEGNTALHLAAYQRFCITLKLLVEDERVDKTVINRKGLTVIDILLLKEYGFVDKALIIKVANNGGIEGLAHALNKNGRKPRKLGQPRQSVTNEPASDTRHRFENRANLDLLVTTLIFGISFAAAFTMPGGYKDDGPDEGMAVLSRKSTFMMSVMANVLAFSLSAASMLMNYRKTSAQEPYILSYYEQISTLLTGYSICALVIAFGLGTYTTLTNYPPLARAVLCFVFFYVGVMYLLFREKTM